MTTLTCKRSQVTRYRGNFEETSFRIHIPELKFGMAARRRLHLQVEMKTGLSVFLESRFPLVHQSLEEARKLVT